MIERDSQRRARYLNTRSYFTVSNTALGERLAAWALDRCDSIYGRAQRVAAANLALLDQIFREHADRLAWVRPSGGMTAFPWLVDGGDAREFCRALAGAASSWSLATASKCPPISGSGSAPAAIASLSPSSASPNS